LLFSRNYPRIIITDNVRLPEAAVAIIAARTASSLSSNCVWYRLNHEFKIDPRYFNANVFADFEVKHKAKRIMRADPVCIVTGLNGAMLADSKPKDLKINQAIKISEELMSELTELDMQLEVATANRWYILADKIRDFSSLPTPCAQNKMLSLDRENLTLNKLNNKLQIALYNSAVNQERNALGLNEINSLWFWGVCDYKAKRPKSRVKKTIFSDDAEIKMYAKYFNIKFKPLTEFTLNYKNAIAVITSDNSQFWQRLESMSPGKLSLEYQGLEYK